MDTTVIYHSADFDGIFCREIARKFLPDANLIGWNFGDAKIRFPIEGTVYILDLSPECLTGEAFPDTRVVWIDHHKTSIEKWPASIPGYRIDGVAACRLAWQWFSTPQLRHKSYEGGLMPSKIEYVERELKEPLAVRLAGEYDVWDKRDPDAELFQYGLRSVKIQPDDWTDMLTPDHERFARAMVQVGGYSQIYARNVDAGNMKASFLRDWEGLKFLCLNGRGNSLTFASRDVPETGHDALLMFYFQGSTWVVSLYHALHRTDLDLSVIAKKYGGGGHKGACGFTCTSLPWLA